MPPAATTTLPATVSVRAVVCSNWSTPETPWPTVTLLTEVLTSIVTVVPSAITTSSVGPGTLPPQVAGALHKPVATLVTVAVARGGTNACAASNGAGACAKSDDGIATRGNV